MEEQFLKRMEQDLKEEYPDFVKSLEQPLFQGLRISDAKAPAEIIRQSLPFLEEPVPFAPDTWYIHGQYGLHPAHLQGLIYMQEPSASGIVELLDIEPDHTVLDLCAAPGSKSTRIAQKIKSGFLIANEIDAKRAQILLSNLERMGAENFALTSQDSASICRQFPETFDRILVDAPCSGEGMMKKHQAAAQWSYDNVKLCAARQKEILENAWKALKPGGILVYSTCTYAKEENEENARWLLETFKDAVQLPIDVDWGRPGYQIEGYDGSLCRRVYPMDGGEGHFAAKFQKTAAGEGQPLPILKPQQLPEMAAAFVKEQKEKPFAYYHLEKSKDEIRVFGMNHPFVKIKGKVLRQGVSIGSVIKKRFEPDHAFYLCASMAKEALRKTETTLEQMNLFVHGEQLNLNEDNGFRALCYGSIPYGFGKSSQGRITNKYPKGLRLLPKSSIMSLDEEQ